MEYGTKVPIFYYINGIRDEPGLVMTLFDGLFLREMKRYEVEIFRTTGSLI